MTSSRISVSTVRHLALAVVAALIATLALVSAPVDVARAAAADMYTMLNQYRVANGRPALVRVPALDTVAQNWTNQMKSSGELEHNPSYYRQYPSGWTAAAENVGYGYSDRQLHDAFAASAGHRENMLDPAFNAVGIGYARDASGRIWVTKNFAALPNAHAHLTPSAADRGLVKAVYLDMLGRAPDPAGWDHWARHVTVHGRGAVADGFGNSREYRVKMTTAAYQQVLGRTPGASEVDGWVGALARGSVTLDRIPMAFYASDEFYVRAGGSNEAFIRQMYRVALGRTSVTPPEIAHWNTVINTQGRATVISGIYSSPESARNRVDAGYQRWLRRSAGPSEQAYWERTVLTHGDEGMRRELMISQEYYTKAQTR